MPLSLRRPQVDAAQLAELAALVEAGPDVEVDGVVSWRCVDLQGEIARRFDVTVSVLQRRQSDGDREAMERTSTLPAFRHEVARARAYAKSLLSGQGSASRRLAVLTQFGGAAAG